ncbi:hypothetical protein D3C76_1548330 [compost metagenome]
MALSIQCFDGLQFIRGQQIPLCLVDANLRGNRLGGVEIVAGQHQGLDAQVM